jgi:uncharacterized protein
LLPRLGWEIIQAMRSANRLARETSPYLLQHAGNPVDWFPWGEEAFARARAEEKPVLLSVGYSSCHWCHVMERESFEDAATAALMNELFVSVKVDREERPDVDAVYMRAVQALTGQGGWPLTAFLTPDGEPFFGGTYFPPEPRHGLPSFQQVLRAAGEAYRSRRGEVGRAADELGAVLKRLAAPPPATHGETVDEALLEHAFRFLTSHYDSAHGGFGRAPKFPQPGALEFLLHQHARTGAPRALEMVVHTLRSMARGGIRDHLGGGFHRYTVDARWLVPHFEKMLYDNALLLRLYLAAWQQSGDAELLGVARETARWILSDMRGGEGGLYSAWDADSEGEEGRFYVWTPAEVRALVPQADADLVCRYWDISDGGNFEGRNIPHVTISIDEGARLFGRDPMDAARAIADARDTLYEARSRRVPPLRDDKVLAGWNGLMLGTLARAGRILDEPRWIAAADRNATFLWTTMRRDGRLMHTWRGGEAKILAFLDDHAFVAGGLLDLYEATGDASYLDRARALAGEIERHFRDPERGGYFFTPNDGESLLTRFKPGADGAVPAGNGAVAMLLLRLHALTGDDELRNRAEEVLRLFATSAARNPFGFVSYIEALEVWTNGFTEVVIVGKIGPERTVLERAAARRFVANGLTMAVDPDAEGWLPAPARSRGAVGGRATAYVCRNFSCSAPVTSAADLIAVLENATA